MLQICFSWMKEDGVSLAELQAGASLPSLKRCFQLVTCTRQAALPICHCGGDASFLGT